MPTNTSELLKTNDSIVQHYGQSRLKKAELLFKSWSNIFSVLMRFKGCKISYQNKGNKVIAQKEKLQVSLYWKDPDVHENYIEFRHTFSPKTSNQIFNKTYSISTPQLDHYPPRIFEPLYGSADQQSVAQKVLNLYSYNQYSFSDLEALNVEYGYELKADHLPYIRKIFNIANFNIIRNNLLNISFETPTTFLEGLEAQIGYDLTYRYGNILLPIIQKANFPIYLHNGDNKTLFENGSALQAMSSVFGVEDFELKNVQTPLPVINHVSSSIIGKKITIDGMASKGENLQYNWRVLGPDGNEVEAFDLTESKSHFYPDTSGTYTIELNLKNDAQIQVFAQSTFLAIDKAEANFIETTGQTNAAISPIPTFNFTTIDPLNPPDSLCKGDIASYSWSEKNGKGTFTSTSTPTTSYTPSESGEFEIQLIVTDSSGYASEPFIYLITIYEPIIATFTVQPPSLSGTQNFTTFLIDASDSTGKLLNYTWNLVDPSSTPVASIASINSPELSLTLDQVGNYTIDLTVTDTNINVSDTSAPQTLAIVEAPDITIVQTSTDVITIDPTHFRGTLSHASETIQFDTTLNAGTGISYLWKELLSDGTSGSFSPDNMTEDVTFTPTQPGSYEFRLEATDVNGAKAISQSIYFQISPAPVAVINVDRLSGSGGVPFEIDAENSIGDGLTYSWDIPVLTLNTDYTMDDLGGSPSTTAEKLNLDFNTAPGNYDLELTVTDFNGVSATSILNLEIVNPPDATIYVLDDSLTEGFNTSFSLRADVTTGIAPFIYNWSVVADPGGATYSFSQNGTADSEVVFQADVAGTYTIQLDFVDSEGVSNAALIQRNLDITTKPVAVIDLLSPASFDSTMTGASIVYNLSGDNSTPTNIIGYEWRVLNFPSGDTGKFNNNSTFYDSGATDTADFTVIEPGDYEIQLVVKDDNDVSSDPVTQSFRVSPRPVAIPYVEGQSTFDATANQSLQLQGNASIGDSLTYQWNATGPGTLYFDAVSTSSSTQMNPVFRADLPGTYNIQLVVTDVNLQSSTASNVTVNLSEAPEAIIIVPAPVDPTSVTLIPGLDIQLDGSTSEPVADAGKEFHWSIGSVPAGGTTTGRFNDSHAENPLFSPNAEGTWEIELYVIDSNGAQSPTVTQTIVVDPFPVADFTFEVNSSNPYEWTLTGGANIPLGDISEYLWTCNPAGAFFSPANNTQITTFTAPDTGNYSIGLQVRDSNGVYSEFEYKTIQVTVPLSTSIDCPSTAVLNGSVFIAQSTEDNSAFQYQWTLSKPNGSDVNLELNDYIFCTFTPDITGIYTLNLEVTDTVNNATATASKRIYISDGDGSGNPLPYAEFVVGNGNTGDTITLNAANSIGDGLTYNWQFITKPAASSATITPTGTASPNASYVPDLIGTYEIGLIVTDSYGEDSVEEKEEKEYYF